MPTPPRRLPQSRGFRKGPDAAVNQAESESLRQNLIPQTRLYVSSITEGAPGTTGVSVANRAFFFPVAARNFVVHATEARVYVNTGSAGSTIKTAVYVWDRATRQLKIIPGSDALFDSSGTGLLTAEVDCYIPQEECFVAFLGSSATPSMSCTTLQTRTLATLHQSGLTALPRVVAPAALTKNYNTRYFSVTYLSTEGANLL